MRKRPLPVIKIDAQDQALFEASDWYISPTGYIRRMWIDDGKMHSEYLHRLLAKPPKGKTVDHINGDKTDNRRSNLRVCSHRDNCRSRYKVKKNPRNKSGFLGVFPQDGRWRAMIRVGGKALSLGMYDNPQDGARAYDAAAKRHFGEFAALNF